MYKQKEHITTEQDTLVRLLQQGKNSMRTPLAVRLLKKTRLDTGYLQLRLVTRSKCSQREGKRIFKSIAMRTKWPTTFIVVCATGVAASQLDVVVFIDINVTLKEEIKNFMDAT